MSTAVVFDILARDRASNTFDHVGDSATRSTGKLRKFAVAGAAAVGVAAVAAGRALIGMGQAAVEDEKAQATLARALKNSTGATKGQIASVEDWITAQGKAKGIADDELRPALARLATATGSVQKAQRLTSLAMDVSAGTGKSLKTVTEALQKAQNGSLGGLSRLGVATKDQEGNEKSLAQVTRELAQLHGGQAAAAADTNAGKMQRLKLMYDETKEAIGARLIPVVATGADKVMKFVDEWEKGTGAGGRAADAFDRVKGVLGGVKDNLGTIAPALGVVTAGWVAYTTATKVAAIATAIQTAGTVGATGATWSLNAALRANPIGLVVTLLTAMGVGLVVAYKKSETFRAIVDGVWGAVKTGATAMWNGGIKPAFEGMKTGFQAVGKAGIWLWNNALQPAFKAIVGGIGWVLGGWADMLHALSKVPGFGWAKAAAEKMEDAAAKAYKIADGIRKIPTSKTVNVTVAYRYTGLRGPGGSGPTRGRDDGFEGRLVPDARKVRPLADRVMEVIADAYREGGKKAKKVLGDNLQQLRTTLKSIRDEMKSMSESVASAINQTDFGGGIGELMASLTGNQSALGGLGGVWDKLKGSVSKGFLSSLMQSGNVGLATALGNDPAAAANASALFDANAAAASRFGDATAQQVLGDRLDAAATRETKKLLEKLDDLPEKWAKKLRKELEGMRFEVRGSGRDAGGQAYLMGGR